MKNIIENGKLKKITTEDVIEPNEICIIIKNQEALNYVQRLFEAMGYIVRVGKNSNEGYTRYYSKK